MLVRADMSPEEASLVGYCLAMARVEYEPDAAGYTCYGEVSASPEEARGRIHDELRRAGVEHAVVKPLRILRWDEERARYVDPDEPEGPQPLHPAGIGWKVTVVCRDAARPCSARSPSAHGRFSLSAAGSSRSARATSRTPTLSTELQELPSVSSAVPERLSTLARWRVRQKLLGNYAGEGYW